MIHYASFKIYSKKRKEVQRGGGTKPILFKKFTNFKLGVPNLLLMYSLLMGSWVLGHHSEVLVGSDKPLFAKPSAQ